MPVLKMERFSECGLRSDEFAKALGGDRSLEEVHTVARFRDSCVLLLSRAPFLLLALAVASAVLLLAVRPPFVVSFEYDQKHPWKGSQSVSWVGVVVTTLLVVLAPLAVHLASPSGGH